MSTRPIPVRLPDDLVVRLDAAAKRIGSNRAALIRFCTETWLSHYERTGVASMPPDWETIIRSYDGRRAPALAGKGGRPRRHKAAEQKAEDPPEEIPVKVVEHVPSPVGPDYECAVDRYMRRRVREARKGKQASGSGVEFPSDAPRG